MFFAITPRIQTIFMTPFNLDVPYTSSATHSSVLVRTFTRDVRRHFTFRIMDFCFFALHFNYIAVIY